MSQNQISYILAITGFVLYSPHSNFGYVSNYEVLTLPPLKRWNLLVIGLPHFT